MTPAEIAAALAPDPDRPDVCPFCEPSQPTGRRLCDAHARQLAGLKFTPEAIIAAGAR